MIEAVIFDMDGLLIDSEPLWRKAEIEVFGSVGVQLTYDMCGQTAGLRIDEVVNVWYQKQPWEGPSQQEIIDQIIDRLIELIQAEGKAMSGVESAMNLCKSFTSKIALASSSSYRIIHAVLDKLNLKEHFEIVHSAEEEKAGKPHPQVFINAAIKLGIAPNKCLVFEDSFNGVVAGLAARMHVIAIPEKDHFQQKRFQCADKILTSLEDFELNLVQELSENLK